MQGSGLVLAVTVGVAAYGGLLAALIYAATQWGRRRSQLQISGLAAGLPAARRIEPSPGATTAWGRIESEYTFDGRRFALINDTYTRSLRRISLRLPAGPYPALLVFPEGKFERLGKRLGISREVQTGDASFDAAAYLDSPEEPQAIEKLLAAAPIRAALLEVLALGYSVEFSFRGVEAFQLVRVGTDVDGSRAPQLLSAMGRIVDAAPPFPDAQARVTDRTKRTGLTLLLVASWALGAMTFGLCQSAVVHTVNSGVVALAFFVGGGVCWALYVFGLVLLLRGRSDALRIVLVAAVLGVLSVPLAAGSVFLQLNRSLDSSPATVYERTILKHHGQSKGHCTVEVEGWGESFTETLALKHSGGDAEFKAGTRVTVRVHPGAFGAEWTERLNP